MTEGQKLLRRMRWRDRLAFIIPFVVFFVCASGLSVSLYHFIRPRSVLVVSLFGAFVCYVVYFLADYIRGRHQLAQLPPTTEVVTLDQFLSDPDAIITPNHQEVSEAVSRWLTEFRQRHGLKSVFIDRDVDEPHIANLVVLVTPQLTDADKQTLLYFHADGISTLNHKDARRFIPDLSADARTFLVAWD